MSTPAAALCKNRGCGNPVAGPRFTACGPCLMGNRPAMRRKVAAAAAVEAMPALVTPEGSWGFRLPGSPMSQNRAWRWVNGHMHKTDAAKDWQTAVRLAAAKAKPKDWSLDGPVAVELLCVFDRSTADVDNPAKLVLDALQDRRVKTGRRMVTLGPGVAYHSDKQVSLLTLRKAVDPAAARLECVIRRLP